MIVIIKQTFFAVVVVVVVVVVDDDDDDDDDDFVPLSAVSSSLSFPDISIDLKSDVKEPLLTSSLLMSPIGNKDYDKCVVI